MSLCFLPYSEFRGNIFGIKRHLGDFARTPVQLCPTPVKSLADILTSLVPATVFGIPDRLVSSVEYDSRRCREYSLFVAMPGAATDGHLYIEAAIMTGARTVICERLPDERHAECTYVVVPDARAALALASHAYYDFPAKKLRVIGVTGTNGKTTVTFLLKAMLEKAGEKVGLIGTTGNYMGEEMLPATHTTPEAPELCRLFADMRLHGVSTVIMEVSSHALALRRVVGIPFAAALFTNLTHDHLDFHGTMENYSRTKKMLFDSLAPDAIALADGDNGYSMYMLCETKARRAYMTGRSGRFDAVISNEKIGLNGSTFTLKFCGKLPPELHGEDEFSIKLPGHYNVENAALCVVLGRLMELPEAAIKKGLAGAKGAPGRMQRINLPDGVTAFVDYAHTPDALRKSMGTCRELLPQGGRLIAVFGCGGNRDPFKRPVMGSIAAELAEKVIVTADNPRNESPEQIIQEIISGIPKRQRAGVRAITSRRAAIREAVGEARSGDVIIIAGKGHETYQIIGADTHYFNDVEEVTEAGKLLAQA